MRADRLALWLCSATLLYVLVHVVIAVVNGALPATGEMP